MLQLLKECIEYTSLQDVHINKNFLTRTPISEEISPMINKLDDMKFKMFYPGNLIDSFRMRENVWYPILPTED